MEYNTRDLYRTIKTTIFALNLLENSFTINRLMRAHILDLKDRLKNLKTITIVITIFKNSFHGVINFIARLR